MKTSKLMLTVALALLMYSCEQQSQKSVKHQVESEEVPNERVPKPDNLMTIEAAKKQLKNFQDAHPGVNGDEYALRSWIALEDLEKYIAYVRQEASEKGIEVNGIEFIYTQTKAAKPYLPNLSNSDYGLNFMYAPTYLDGSMNVAFDPVNSKQGEPATLKELLKDKNAANDEGKTPEQLSNPSGIGNYINSCPEICN